MNWLLWKEYRLQRLALAVGLFLLVAPFAFPIIALVRGDSSPDIWQGACFFSLLCSILPLALLGGNAIASERVDRSAEFLGYQPISRQKILLSKLALPLAMALTVWFANVAVSAATSWHPDRFLSLGVVAIAGLCALGVAWLVSSFQASPTFAFASGILAPIVVALLIGSISWLARIQSEAFNIIGFVAVAAVVGLLGGAGGIWCYLRRIEP